jgi:hypothetical protein
VYLHLYICGYHQHGSSKYCSSFDHDEINTLYRTGLKIMNNERERCGKSGCDIIQGITSHLPVGLRNNTQNINQDDVTSATRNGNPQNNTQKPHPPPPPTPFEAISTTKYPLTIASISHQILKIRTHFRHPSRRHNREQNRSINIINVHLITGHGLPQGEKMYSYTLSLFLALDGGAGGQRHAPAVLPGPGTHCGPPGRSAQPRNENTILKR